MFSMFPTVTFTQTTLSYANTLLVEFGHKMGPLKRGNQGAICHVLLHDGRPMAVTTASNLIAPVVGGASWLMRENTIELSRLCAVRSNLNRVMLRLWREFVFPFLGYTYAVSYQDADLHTGNTYRFDGWQRVSFSHSGTDTRSGRAGRNKFAWQWPPANNVAQPPEPGATAGEGGESAGKAMT